MILAFDLDGTLITAEAKQSCLLGAVASRYGLHLESEEIWSKKREGSNNLTALKQLGIDEVLAQTMCTAWLREIETPYWQSMDTLFTDTLTTLDELKSSGFELILITARQNEYLMRQQIYRLDIARYFNDIFCVSPQSSIRDKEQVLRDSKAIAFIGDSESDFQSAKFADIPFYGVCTGQRSKKFLINSGVASVDPSLACTIQSFLKGVV